MWHAPLWWYRNCAIALGVDLDDILDAREREWRGHQQTVPEAGWIEEVIRSRQ